MRECCVILSQVHIQTDRWMHTVSIISQVHIQTDRWMHIITHGVQQSLIRRTKHGEDTEERYSNFMDLDLDRGDNLAIQHQWATTVTVTIAVECVFLTKPEGSSSLQVVGPDCSETHRNNLNGTLNPYQLSHGHRECTPCIPLWLFFFDQHTSQALDNAIVITCSEDMKCHIYIFIYLMCQHAIPQFLCPD